VGYRVSKALAVCTSSVVELPIVQPGIIHASQNAVCSKDPTLNQMGLGIVRLCRTPCVVMYNREVPESRSGTASFQANLVPTKRRMHAQSKQKVPKTAPCCRSASPSCRGRCRGRKSRYSKCILSLDVSEVAEADAQLRRGNRPSHDANNLNACRVFF
jgi:hypothetical protein